MDLLRLSEDLVSVVDKVKDSVFSIVTTRITADLLLRPIPVKGIGSGFAVDERGFIITNNHVVEGAEVVEVYSHRGEKYKALIVSRDPTVDLALLKVPNVKLKPIPLGDSSKVRVGELVLAIGSPLGLPGPSVTLGIVSSIGRNIVGEDVILEDLIQTDAAINPGNSGGPLLNISGEVIGVTTAMIPYAQGIGFAIPIDCVKRFITMIAKYGRPIHPKIGVYVVDINPAIQSYYGLPTSKGLLVVKVVYSSPAHRAGIDEGDIIVAVNEREVTKTRELRIGLEDSIDRGYAVIKVLKPSGYYNVKVPLYIE